MVREPFRSHGPRSRAYLHGGAIVVQDDSSNDLVTLGQLPDDSHGIEIVNTAGAVVYEVNESGQQVPFLHLPMGSTGGVSGMAITNASFGGDGQYLVDFYVIAKRVTVTWAALFPGGASSTMEVRTTFAGPTNAVLDLTAGLTSSVTGTVDEELPSDAIGSTCRLVVEARRASGSDVLGLNIALQPRNYG